MLERGGGDQGVGCGYLAISLEHSAPLGDSCVQRKLLQWRKQPANHLRIIASGKQLAASDY